MAFLGPKLNLLASLIASQLHSLTKLLQICCLQASKRHLHTSHHHAGSQPYRDRRGAFGVSSLEAMAS